MEENNFIFTISGVRGIFGKNLNFNIAKKIAIAYGLWLKSDEKKVILGRDTRPSGEDIEKAIIEGLNLVKCKVVNLGICPTPIIFFAKNRLNIPGGIIISGSHNPPEWNGVKLFSTKTFLNRYEVEELSTILNTIKLDQYPPNMEGFSLIYEKLNVSNDYIQALYNNINLKKIKEQNKLKVVIDTGAGAGKYATPEILKGMGCEVNVINNDLDENNNFPREIEPVKKNLNDLVSTVLDGSYDVGFAHDCDADRLAIVGNDGTCYPEDVGLALIADFYLKKTCQDKKKTVFVTNLASSLVFDALAEKYNAQVIRTPVGEYHLAEMMNNLIEKEKASSLIFGGEGSCGGVMLPHFNNTRDGIFAAAKLVEILVETNEKVSFLVSRLPKYFSFREYIRINVQNTEKIIENLKEKLISEGENVSQIDMDLRFGQGKDWFVLIHPSNTEPIFRVIVEAKTESVAKKYLAIIVDRIKTIVELNL